MLQTSRSRVPLSRPSKDTPSWVKTLKSQALTVVVSYPLEITIGWLQVEKGLSPSLLYQYLPEPLCVPVFVFEEPRLIIKGWWNVNGLALITYLWIRLISEPTAERHSEGGGWCEKRCGRRIREVLTLFFSHLITPVGLHSIIIFFFFYRKQIFFSSCCHNRMAFPVFLY